MKANRYYNKYNVGGTKGNVFLKYLLIEVVQIHILKYPYSPVTFAYQRVKAHRQAVKRQELLRQDVFSESYTVYSRINEITGLEGKEGC